MNVVMRKVNWSSLSVLQLMLAVEFMSVIRTIVFLCSPLMGVFFHLLGELNKPHGLAFDTSGVVYVCEGYNNRIEAF